MADENTTGAVVEAEGAAEQAEARQYTAEDIRKLPKADLLELIGQNHPGLSEYTDERAEAIHNEEMERVRPAIVSEAKEEAYREQEDAYLVQIGRTQPDKYYEVLNQINANRDVRLKKAREAAAGGDPAMEALLAHAQKRADRLLELNPEAVEALKKRRWPVGATGVESYTNAVDDAITEAIAERRAQEIMSKREAIIAETERKQVLSEREEETPDKGGAAAPPTGKMTQERFDRLPLPERMAFRKKNTAEYNRMLAG